MYVVVWWLFILHALIIVKHLVVGWVSSVWAMVCMALLCQLVQRLFMCVFVQHGLGVGMCHLSEHRYGQMSCLKACFLI